MSSKALPGLRDTILRMIRMKYSHDTCRGRALGTVSSHSWCSRDSVRIAADTVPDAHSDRQKRVDGWLLKQ